MPKTILLTGATDSIGLAAVPTLVEQGHTVLIHGRHAAKLAELQTTLTALPGAGLVQSHGADLSR
jgi:NADP-dependent 3-hydroxy acid dehydrogenase YdfG